MSNNYTTITSIINAKYKVDNLDVLEEAGVMTVKITRCPTDASLTLYRFDPNTDNIFPFFAKGIGLRSICDYIFLIDYNESLYILLIELKHGRKSATDQLNGTEELISYIIASAKRINQEVDRDSIYVRKIKISERRHIRTTKTSSLEYDSNRCINYPWTDFILKHY